MKRAYNLGITASLYRITNSAHVKNAQIAQILLEIYQNGQ
jgi:hypothetical protein